MTEAAVAGLRLLVAQVAAMDAADRRRLVEELPVAHQRTLLENGRSGRIRGSCRRRTTGGSG